MVSEFQDPALQDTSPLNQPDENHDDGHDEQNMDESAHGGTGHQAKDPEEEKDDCDGH